MTISKKTLDEAIKLYKEYVAKDFSHNIYVKHFRLLEELLSNINITAINVSELIGIFVTCEKTNETIYKAIELLGIEIEGEEQSESKPKYERLTDRDIAVTLNNNECEDITRFLRYAQRLWELENKIEQGKLVFREGNNEQI